METTKYAAILIAATVLAASAQATDVFWSAGSGDWSNAANWGGTVPNDSSYNAYFSGVGNVINMDADYTAGAIRANYSSPGLNTLSGPGTLTINGNAANVLGFANQSGTAGTLYLNGNMLVNNTGGNFLTDARNDNNSGNATEFGTGSTLTLNTPLVTLNGAGGTISFNGTLASSSSYLAIQSANVSFGAGHDSSGFGQNIVFWGSNRKLTVDGGTVLAPGRKFESQGANNELDLNAANAINGANLSVLASDSMVLGVNSDQANMGAITLGTGANLTINLQAGVAALDFADSSADTWGGTVTINGFQEGVIQFGSGASGLTSAQLATIDGGIYSLTSQGYLTMAAVPEPTTLGLLVFSGLGLLAARRKRM